MAQGAAKSRVERRFAAILAADVVGYSRLMGLMRKALDNRFLLKSLQDMHDSVVMMGRTIFAAPGRIAEALTEHQAIVAAIARRDDAEAEEVARRHVRRGLRIAPQCDGRGCPRRIAASDR
jgi:DNA-binding GntR family transcriptional regulator